MKTTNNVATVGEMAWKFEYYRRHDDGPAGHAIVRGIEDKDAALASLSLGRSYVISAGYRVVLTGFGWEREEHAKMPTAKVSE